MQLFRVLYSKVIDSLVQDSAASKEVCFSELSVKCDVAVALCVMLLCAHALGVKGLKTLDQALRCCQECLPLRGCTVICIFGMRAASGGVLCQKWTNS